MTDVRVGSVKLRGLTNTPATVRVGSVKLRSLASLAPTTARVGSVKIRALTAAHPPVYRMSGTGPRRVHIVGWWDGAAIQPMTTLGCWDGAGSAGPLQG